jgi:hypothetical protein
VRTVDENHGGAVAQLESSFPIHFSPEISRLTHDSYNSVSSNTLLESDTEIHSTQSMEL